ncbi:hypothetical protein J4050_14165 [Winogradskyella sp. DF17]|uniref:JAB domain-containing protein n=1 Tax=Winogradskyella pelagia TaxID=2819984 RepID=A0ABS3T594_9FLAO|nr:hypothetical protein [Winogradskyella sp. DF17]MBO3117897.1 hypothetical protein [Winogradskyella sp. DF17]
MKVNVTKGHVKLFNGNMENARQSAMGEVDTSKEIVVVNENNTKYTYKVNTVEETSTSVTNIIVVDTGDELFEYFIKYNFDNEIPMHEAGVVDISRFTGTIETYNSEGQLTGVTEIVNGSVVNGSGTNTPCPDDTSANDDPVGDDSDGTGGAQGSVGDDDPNNPNDDGGGGWFDGGPDWDCGLNYHYDECTGGASDLHEPRENSSLPGGMCSGTLLIITDCEGNVISSSGVFARNTESTDTTNPCGGSAGVIIEPRQSHKDNCDKLNELLDTGPEDANALQFILDLRQKATNKTDEWYINFRKVDDFGTITSSSAEGALQQGKDLDSEALKGPGFYGQIHSHPTGSAMMFSWNDINSLKEVYEKTYEGYRKDVFIMIVGPSPANEVYAVKVDDFNKLADGLEQDLQNVSGNDLSKKKRKLKNKFRTKYRAYPTKKDGVFLRFFQNHGISLYKPFDSNMTNWEKLELQDPSGNGYYTKTIPCI